MNKAFPFRTIETIEDILADAEAFEIRAGHAIDAVRTRLPPEALEAAEPEEIFDDITAEQLSLSRERRTHMHREALASIQEMEGVVRILSGYMQVLSSQRNKVVEHASAATAYTRTTYRYLPSRFKTPGEKP